MIICLIVFLEVAAYSHSKLLAVSRSAVPDGQRKVLATIQQNDPYRLQFNMIFPHYPAYKSRNTIEGESRADEFPPDDLSETIFYGYDFGSNAFQGHITLPFWTSWSRKQMYGEYYDLLTIIEKNPLAQRDLWMSVANEDTKMYAFYHQAYVAPDREDVLEIMKNIWFSMDNLILESQPKNEDDSLRLPITPETYNPEPIMQMETAPALKEGPITANDIHLEIESDKPGFIVFFSQCWLWMECGCQRCKNRSGKSVWNVCGVGNTRWEKRDSFRKRLDLGRMVYLGDGRFFLCHDWLRSDWSLPGLPAIMDRWEIR